MEVEVRCELGSMHKAAFEGPGGLVALFEVTGWPASMFAVGAEVKA